MHDKMLHCFFAVKQFYFRVPLIVLVQGYLLFKALVPVSTMAMFIILQLKKLRFNSGIFLVR
ncbi:MAG: hypothetical protein JWR38_991 [Mucilaginibacter sp.]|nr:hypothetical protein [Mucilaginibacter sp.]